ncbi:MAG: biotin carboxylase N-terminal domain-containing protein [Chloroflexota bacterium]|jgi:acetyl/propionyl-CoA carboxylase alpha subunit|nr:biotin carboxylase N-terminal domain-containing protein [Chloroflexota bacterium]
MFSKVLVANRGEIAVRVVQTLQAMGIVTAVVYSEPDSNSLHVALADEAFELEGSTVEETYLDRHKIIDLALSCGAQAVHPGYGFLSESPKFSQDCIEAGLVFIGPRPETIALLGDKIRSKETAVQAGVPLVPSSSVWQPGESDMDSLSSGIGFPLLVKASAGGGGRGMRVVERVQDLEQALESASREAASAFSDGRVFLERYIPTARHVEFQILADSEGNTIHLFERECSVQRRYQKVIEETPSQALNDDLRRRMASAAVAMAKSADYTNAGTVEFLVDALTGEYFFLEMNARIQVEHPITEETLKLDMVEWQMRIAAGENLPFSQEDIRPIGHAVECRIYAEDPYSNFTPSTGRLLAWRPPSGMGIRLDSGVTEGQEVTTYYDSMLAKLVSWGPDREESIGRMLGALKSFPVLGVATNIPFLLQALIHPDFVSGKYDTGFIDRHSSLISSLAVSQLGGAATRIADLVWQPNGNGSVRREGATVKTLQSPWQGLPKSTFP